MMLEYLVSTVASIALKIITLNDVLVKIIDVTGTNSYLDVSFASFFKILVSIISVKVL